MCHNPTIPAAGLSELGWGPPDFDRSVDPISTEGEDCANQIILAPPDFQTFLQFLPQITPSFHFLLVPLVLYSVPNNRH